jgi:RecA-family ATPase
LSDKPSLYPTTWRPSTLKEILNRQYEPPPWIIKDLLPKDAGTLASGLPHSTKSLSWLGASIESVVNQTVWGHFDASKVRRSLFIETEDPRWLVEDRIRGFATGLGLDPSDLSDLGFGLACTGPFHLITSQIQVQKLIEEWEPDWVVLSTLQGLIQGADWAEQKDMGPVNAAIVRLQRICPLVVVTHSPRGGQRRAAGTVTQDANYLTLMHFEKYKREDGTYISVLGDSKMGSELDFNLKLEVVESDGRSQVRSLQYVPISMSKRDRVLQLIVQHPGADPSALALLAGCTKRYVQEIMKEEGVANKYRN